LYNAAQALDFRRPSKTSPYLESFIEEYRRRVSFIEDDKVMYEDINESVKFLREVTLAPELKSKLL
jgi:histidine ammonia-lyase